jgi:TnpA family transposase
LFSGTINHDLILGRWDDLVRLAASLKMGWATASLLVGKLQSHRRQNAVLRASRPRARSIQLQPPPQKAFNGWRATDG